MAAIPACSVLCRYIRVWHVMIDSWGSGNRTWLAGSSEIHSWISLLLSEDLVSMSKSLSKSLALWYHARKNVLYEGESEISEKGYPSFTK